jgi:hypothetical protein
LINELQSYLNTLKQQEKAGEPEIIIGTIPYLFGIAPPILGFAVLTSHGNLYRMDNKNPLSVGEVFKYVGRIDDRTDFISISHIPATEGSKQFFLALTRSGDYYVSEDLKSWTYTGTIDFVDR